MGREVPVYTIPAGLQDTEWGSPSSLDGLLGTAFICHEALQPTQTLALYKAGESPTRTHTHTNFHTCEQQRCNKVLSTHAKHFL